MKPKVESEIENIAQKQNVCPSPQTSRSVSFVELRQSLPTEIAIISPFVQQLMRFIARFRNVDGSESDIETALHEALANAIVHGNQMDPHKLVYVACRCAADGEVSLTVQDEGSGFENGSVPDPTTADHRLLTHGRGIYLMRTLMDEVCFEQGGTVVYMRKSPNADSTVNRKSQ
jgi:serine/threonine-protein kinase RsbW